MYKATYFEASEFACKCGCGLNVMSEAVIKRVDILRGAVGFPININSGCRCHEHNSKIGGALLSTHTIQDDGKCHGLDICNARTHSLTSRERFLIIQTAIKLKLFKRMGIGKTFIHLDDWTDDNHPNEVIWVY